MEKPVRQVANREVIGFGLAGAGAMLVDLLVFNALVLTGSNVSFSSILAATVGLSLNFVVNRRTFLPRAKLWRGARTSGIRFVAVALMSYLVLIVGFEIFFLAFPEASSGLLNTVRIALVIVGTGARFILYKFWVFQPPV